MSVKKAPWKVSSQYKDVVVNSRGEMVADCSILLKSRTDEDNYVNAKLIASAPQLMDCLMKLDKAIDNGEMNEISKCQQEAKQIIANL